LSPDRAQLREAAQQFEAIFVRQMLASARSVNFGNDLMGQDQGGETFAQMRDERFADIAAKSGSFGLGKQIEAQLLRTLPSGAADQTATTPTAKGS
jgi:flagellar protein FlgJ